MSPWRKVGELMDAVPEDARRLESRYAWSPFRACGCVFGTLYPETPRHPDRTTQVNFEYGFHRVEVGALRGIDPTYVGFHAWARQVGLTLDDVASLQQLNDDAPLGAYRGEDARARWREVRAYVARRAAGQEDWQARAAIARGEEEPS